MTMSATFITIDQSRLIDSLSAARQGMEATGGDVVLDFSSVARLDVGAVEQLEKLIGIASDKGATVTLQGVNVDVYRVLKLTDLAPRCSFSI